MIGLVGTIGATGIAYFSLKPRADELQANLVARIVAGQRELEAGKAALKEANSKPDGLSRAVEHFVAAKREFLSANQMADDSRLLRYLEYTPALGRFASSRHSSINGIAQMGAALADVGQDFSSLDGKFIKPSSTGVSSPNLLNVLDQVRAVLPGLRADLGRAQEAAAHVDVEVVPTAQRATFVKAHDSVNAAVAGIAEFERLMPLLKDVLGGNGARTYLVEQVNPAELRAGGGFIGTYSLLGADHGSLKVIHSGNSYDLVEPRPRPGQPDFKPQPGPLREIVPGTGWSFVDSNEFPDFASNAKAALDFVQPRIGKIDAVISIDYIAVAKMLELTGQPLSVPGYNITVDGSNFVDQIVQLELHGDLSAHKAISVALAGPLMSRITSLPLDRWPTLISDLGGLATERHLQAFFSDPNLESEIDRVGWSGRLNPQGVSDYMMEIESNYGGGKSNYFLQRRYAVVLSRNGGALHHRVTIDYINHTPNDINVYFSYRATVRLYVPPTAKPGPLNLRAPAYSYPDPPPGNSVIVGWLPIIPCCGSRERLVIEYDTPWVANPNGMHEIYWQKQPGAVNDKVEVTWISERGRAYTAYGDLSQDRVITILRAGVTLTRGQAALAAPPSLNL